MCTSQPFENPKTPMEEKVKMTLTALPELLKRYNDKKIKYAGYPDPIGRPVFYFTNVPNMSFVCSCHCRIYYNKNFN